MGDVIYGYEGMIRGYKAYIVQSSLVRHNIHLAKTVQLRRLGPRLLQTHIRGL